MGGSRGRLDLLYTHFYAKRVQPETNPRPFPYLPYFVESIHGSLDLDAYPNSWMDALHCHDRKTYVHKMHVPGTSHLPVS